MVRGLIFNGVSTIDQRKERLFLPRIAFDIANELDFISEDVVNLTRTGSLLVADVASNDPVLEAYGSIDLL